MKQNGMERWSRESTYYVTWNEVGGWAQERFLVTFNPEQSKQTNARNETLTSNVDAGNDESLGSLFGSLPCLVVTEYLQVEEEEVVRGEVEDHVSEE